MHKLGQRDRLIRKMVKARSERRDRRRLQYAWYSLCKEVDAKRAYYKVVKNRKTQLMYQKMNQWF
jgi:hypothetical protein